MNNKIKFSILIPTRDRLDLLKYAVNSVINQSYANWELIISDNCSKDDIGSWIAELQESRIVYFRQAEGVSVTENWNTANDLASGDYIIMLGDDDALIPDALKTLEENIISENYPDVLCFPTYLYYQPGVDPRKPDGDIFIVCPLPVENAGNNITLTKEWRRELVEKCINFQTVIGYNMQYYCYSKKNVEQLENYGNYYEPPYPDYYTSCMNMMLADKVVYIPECLTVMGVTPKSYGYYHCNNKEKEGMKFHNESDFRKYAVGAVKDKVCSIDEMDTAAFVTFATVCDRLKMPYPDTLQYYKSVINREVEFFAARGLRDIYNIMEAEMFPHLTAEERSAVCDYLFDVYQTLRTQNENTINKSVLSYMTIADVLSNLGYISKALKTYIPNSRDDIEEWFEKIDLSILKNKVNGRQILLWGAYNRSLHTSELLEKLGFEIKGYIDNNFKDSSYNDKPVYKPNEIAELSAYYVFIPLENVYGDILDLMNKRNLRNIVDYVYLKINNYSAESISDLLGNEIICDTKNQNLKIQLVGKTNRIIINGNISCGKNVLLIVSGSNCEINLSESSLIPENTHIIAERGFSVSGNILETPGAFVLNDSPESHKIIFSV